MTASTSTGWVKLGGYTLFPNDDVEALFEGEPMSRAEKLVLKEPDKYGGFVTVDENPVANPKYLCPIGLTLVWVGKDADPACSLHVYRFPGSLIEREDTLFTDKHELVEVVNSITGTPNVARPGRGEGLADCFGKVGLSLFGPSVEPQHLLQGSAGGCWLGSALGAIVGAQPAQIRGRIKQAELLKPPHLSKNGRYDVTLFHPTTEKWTSIEVDDRIAVKPTRAFAHLPASLCGQIWPCLIEKAVATLSGSYAAYQKAQLQPDGGNPLLAFKMLMGCPNERLLRLHRTSRSWRCTQPVFGQVAGGPACTKLVERDWPDDGTPGSHAGGSHGTDAVLKMLKWLLKGGSLICLSLIHI